MQRARQAMQGGDRAVRQVGGAVRQIGGSAFIHQANATVVVFRFATDAQTADCQVWVGYSDKAAKKRRGEWVQGEVCAALDVARVYSGARHHGGGRVLARALDPDQAKNVGRSVMFGVVRRGNGCQKWVVGVARSGQLDFVGQLGKRPWGSVCG